MEILLLHLLEQENELAIDLLMKKQDLFFKFYIY